MSSQAEVDGKKYCDLMEEVKRRISVVNHFLSGQGHAVYQPTTLETVCLQIRKNPRAYLHSDDWSLTKRLTLQRTPGCRRRGMLRRFSPNSPK